MACCQRWPSVSTGMHSGRRLSTTCCRRFCSPRGVKVYENKAKIHSRSTADFERSCRRQCLRHRSITVVLTNCICLTNSRTPAAIAYAYHEKRHRAASQRDNVSTGHPWTGQTFPYHNAIGRRFSTATSDQLKKQSTIPALHIVTNGSYQVRTLGPSTLDIT